MFYVWIKQKSQRGGCKRHHSFSSRRIQLYSFELILKVIISWEFIVWKLGLSDGLELLCLSILALVLRQVQGKNEACVTQGNILPT